MVDYSPGVRIPSVTQVGRGRCAGWNRVLFLNLDATYPLATLPTGIGCSEVWAAGWGSDLAAGRVDGASAAVAGAGDRAAHKDVKRERNQLQGA